MITAKSNQETKPIMLKKVPIAINKIKANVKLANEARV